jgi:RimJ/RimL family protein N-acetyltransferase
MQPQTISQEPLHLRPLRPADADAVYQACQDPLVQKWTVALPVPYTRADAGLFINVLAPQGWAEDTACTWAIEDPGSEEFLGVISLTGRGDGCDEVGYWLAPAGRGRGVATKALAQVCRFGFECLSLESIRWTAILGNEASRRVAERVGFQVSDPVRRLINQRGNWLDGWIGWLHSLVPGDES